jgi:hypothetical protein
MGTARGGGAVFFQIGEQPEVAPKTIGNPTKRMTVRAMDRAGFANIGFKRKERGFRLTSQGKWLPKCGMTCVSVGHRDFRVW